MPYDCGGGRRHSRAPMAVFRAPAPAASQVSFLPAPPAAPVIIRTPPPSSTSTTTPGAPSFTPAPPRQPAPRSASTPASEPATLASSAPSPAALAKEVEKKPFVSETALAPPAAAAQGTAAAAGAADDASDLDLAPVSKKGLAHPAWPGLATVGKKVMIRANHFVVNVADNNLFHYDVSINPESKSRQTNREVLNEFIKLHGKTALGGKLPAYDGRKSLYTAGSLPFESKEFAVTLVDPEKKDQERAEREYKITIRIAGRKDLYHLQQFLRGRQRDMPQETIQVLDVVLRESPSWNYVTVSRSFFSTTFGHRGDIGEGLECWRGYYPSLRPTQMELSLNIDISATSFFKPVTVIKFVEEFLNLCDTSRPLSDRDRVKIKKALRGVRIETTHQQDQIRRYKITGVTSIPVSQLIFPVDDKGTRQTVVQYFWDEYNYSLKYGSWPCLQAGIIEPLITFPIHPSPFPLGLKHQWSTGLPSMHGGKDDDMANSLIGLLESQQLAQSECPQVPHMKVQFFVSLGGRSLSTQQILEEMTVRKLIEYCCQRNGIRETKVIYGVFCGRPLIDEEFLCHYPICRDSTVDLRSRLRGGQFETYTTRFSKPDRDLFYSVALSQTLQNPRIQDKNKKTVKCVWKLKRCTRFWVKLVLVFFTQQHRANICYNGSFEKEDILFEDGSVSLRAGIVGELFSGPGCWLDFNKLATILKELKTSDGYYAPYFNELIGYLERCPFGENSRHDLAIAFVLNHPAIECFLDRFKQVMLVDAFLFRTLMNRKTPKAHKSIIRKALGIFCDWWHDLYSCPAMKQVLDEGSYVSGGQVFFNALYTDDLSGFFHYSNNYFKHAKKDLKLEEIEAAHSINALDLLPKVFELITGYAINNAGSVHVLKTLLDLIGNDLANPCSEHSQDN